MRLRHDWEKIPADEVPEWVKDRGFLPNYNTSKVVKGRHYIYKIRKTDEVQGGKYYYYRARRFRTYSKRELLLIQIEGLLFVIFLITIIYLLFHFKIL